MRAEGEERGRQYIGKDWSDGQCIGHVRGRGGREHRGDMAGWWKGREGEKGKTIKPPEETWVQDSAKEEGE